MEFLLCKKCGELFVRANDVCDCTPECCGEELTKLEANTTDAAQEKHVPVITRDGNKIDVVVGSTEHPMEEDHWITCIIAVQGNKYQVQKLNPGDAPKANFQIEDGAVEVYEFCNKHGLWKAEA